MIYRVVELSRLTIVGIALVSVLSASGIGETPMILKAEETKSSDETKICYDEDGSQFICPHAQDEGSATVG